MRQLLPQPVDAISLVDAYSQRLVPAPRTSSYIRVNMVSSVDGAAVVNGKTKGLSSAADKRIFIHLRSLTDVILVGANTVRIEGYGPARMTPQIQELRVTRGQSAEPPIAVVSGSCNFDWNSRFFLGTAARPIIITTALADSGRLAMASEVADVLIAGDQFVDMKLAVAQLEARGLRSILCEGGPILNGHLLEAKLLDELCLTLTPALVMDESPRIVSDALGHGPTPIELLALMEEDGFLFFRYGLHNEDATAA